MIFIYIFGNVLPTKIMVVSMNLSCDLGEIQQSWGLTPPIWITNVFNSAFIKKWSVGLCSPADTHANGLYEASSANTPSLIICDKRELST